MRDDRSKVIDEMTPEEKILALEYFQGSDPEGFDEAAREARMRYERAGGYRSSGPAVGEARDDLRQRYAEALAEKFTESTHRYDRKTDTETVEGATPAERVNRQMRVSFVAGDGYRSFTGVTCLEAAEVCAAVGDGELATLREAFDVVMAQYRAYKEEAAPVFAAVGRVRKLHFRYRGPSDFDSCAACNGAYEVPWPCDTIKALDGDLPEPGRRTGDERRG
ncbi:hypothetical protein [Sphaerisporangium sp. TRM90804]|uniref:hypothetical protein n=1 Tax=Sphaerisporangium sp. TRM90804 TaxID=3031113 RepID=UPI00244CD27A|nr:hypothetical protein [Sphaerisporangium sp. TRM90804]MDH2424785.1 hypothetical protein [Sphaerisporangium sp. TRM90804]